MTSITRKSGDIYYEMGILSLFLSLAVSSLSLYYTAHYYKQQQQWTQTTLKKISIG
jgi:hypothetical protein